MDNFFCVILSKFRLYQGLALYHSLERHYPDFGMFILCMDDETYRICTRLKLQKATLIKAEMIEDEMLKQVRMERRLNEYCWTMKPYFIEYVLKHHEKVNHVVYLDADIFFFNRPNEIFESQEDYAVLLSEHDFLEKDSSVEKVCGKYNSGFMIFRRKQSSLALLEWWKNKCLDWCFDAVNENRFGDQKYLDQMPELFEGVYSLKTPGVNIAPWNDDRYQFSLINGSMHINDEKLICYHYCGLRILSKQEYALLIGDRKLNKYIHPPYIKAVRKAMMAVENVMPGFKGFYVEDHFLDRARVFRFSQ